MALPGCGGGSSESTSTQGASTAANGTYLVAALGDSITAGSPFWDPNPAVRSELGVRPNPQSQFEYWARKAVGGVRFRNCGVFGQTTSEIAQRLRACADGADALIVQGGINDIAQGFGSDEGQVVDRAAANLRSMVAEGKRLGLAVMIADVLPWNNGHPKADPAIAHLNRAIDAIGHDDGVPVLPFHDTLERPPGSGLMRSDLTAEGNHPSLSGYALLGQRAVAPALRKLAAQGP